MEVLFISRLFSPHTGGVETHVREVGKKLAKKGYRITIVTEQIPQVSEKEMIDNVRVLRFKYPKIKFIGLLFIWLWFLCHLSLITKSDLVHIHDVFIWYLPFRFLFLTKPVFVTFHGYETHFPLSRKVVFMRKITEWLSWGNICVGDYIKKWYGTKPNLVTYGGVNISKAQNLKLKAQNYSAKLKILFIGRLEKDTGLLQYFKVIKYLREQNFNLDLEFLGEGTLRAEAEKYGKVWGTVENIKSYLRQCCFVFASSYLSILEALAAKKLTFATFDNPLKEDYLKMAPFAKWVVIESSAKKLVEKIVYFLNNPTEYKEKIDNAYQWAKQQSWEEVVVLYSRLWESRDKA